LDYSLFVRADHIDGAAEDEPDENQQRDDDDYRSGGGDIDIYILAEVTYVEYVSFVGSSRIHWADYTTTASNRQTAGRGGHGVHATRWGRDAAEALQDGTCTALHFPQTVCYIMQAVMRSLAQRGAEIAG
jgi:hypothetical protein